MNFYPEADCI